jgi:ACR3 family arsenite efflux pump ArsB
MSVFERYLTLWVALCIVAGVALGNLFLEHVVIDEKRPVTINPRSSALSLIPAIGYVLKPRGMITDVPE